MSRSRQLFASAREGITRFLSKPNTRRTFSQAESGPLPPPVASIYSPPSHQSAAVALAPVLSPHKLTLTNHTVSIPLTTIHKSPPTSTTTHNAAHVRTFSHGSGLLVFINGALMSAANVALASNIASPEMVKQLPLNEFGAIGACLGAAFAEAGSTVDIAWAEVSDETEREWREAERTWEVFAGGPYEAFEMDEYDDETFLRCVRRAQPRRGPPLLPHGKDGGVLVEEGQVKDGGQHVVSEVGVYTPSFYTDPSDGSDALSAFEDDEVIELASITQSKTLGDVFTKLDPDKMVQWSPGKGSGPIMSSAEFEALPDWSDVEDDPEWNGTA